MHILIIHQAFASLNEPGGTRHYEIARNLVHRGHKVTIIASPVSYLTGKSTTTLEETEPGIRIIRAYTYSALHKSFFHRLISFFSFMISSFFNGLKVRNVDLIWGTSPPIFQGFTALLLAALKRKPFLFEVRDLWPEFAISIGILKNPILIAASLWLERLLYKNASAVVVNSPGYVDHVKNHGARQVHLVPNGVDPDMFVSNGNGKQFRREQSLDDKFVVLYAGAHGVSNDLGIILQSADILRNEKNIQFVFVGDGKEKSGLLKQASDLKLPNVIFLPAVPKIQMAEILAAADTCLAILKPLECYKTTYPNKVFDYMAARKPVVLAIDGVIKEVVMEANCGIFAQPGNVQEISDAILWFQQHPDQAKEMGKAGFEYVSSHFHRSDLSRQMSELIERISTKS